MDKYLKTIYDYILEGDQDEVIDAVDAALESGMSPEDVLKKGMIPAMDEVGRLFEEGEFFVPEMLIAARAMQGGLDILRPKLAEAEVESEGKVLIGTVKGDLHDIGKNLVIIMLEGAGFEVIDLGVDVPDETFVSNAAETQPDFVAMSALLTTTLPAMKSSITALKEAGCQAKILVGGAPVTQEYADQIGADGFAPDASQAAKLAKRLMA
ncbi:MAG: corrinoid protein [Anaerolineaceae bacterium]|nr:corrinoid protein [Anaerolineaceae bacterium]